MPVLLIIAAALFLFSVVSVDPWVSVLAGILIMMLTIEVLRPAKMNLTLISYLSLATIMALAVAMLFDFYTVNIGFRLKEIGIAAACLTVSLLILVSMVVHSRLEMNISMAVLSAFFLAIFMITIMILNLYLFDVLVGNTLIIDNRWMMFVVTDITFLILGMWVLLVLFRRSIPFKGARGGSS